MPSSSRRKQSKPQHVANEKGVCEEASTQHVTSSLAEANDDIDDQEYDDKMEDDIINGMYRDDKLGYINRREAAGASYDDDADDCLPCDLSKKSSNTSDRDEGRETQSKEDVNQCSESKPHLDQLRMMTHSTESSNIAQQSPPPLPPSSSRKRYLNDPITSDDNTLTSKHTSLSPYHSNNLPHPSINYNDEPEYGLLSKRARLDTLTSHVAALQYHSAIPPHLEAIYEAGMNRPAGLGDDKSRIFSEGLDNKLILTHTCPVCAKLFSKASDLKRHMMCHTREKPFRCEYCQKPFRAKSSMHYHLKATHGRIEIELSPGLEERYLRRTRSLHRGGHLPGISHLYTSEASNLRRDNLDYEDTEDECKSNDSSTYHSSNLMADGAARSSSGTKSQGHHGNTGSNDKCVLDLTISGKDKTGGKDLQAKVGEVLTYGDDMVKKGKLRVFNETVVVSKVDGMGLLTGEHTSVYRCYICSNVFSNMSKMQYHLSLHSDKHLITYHCCFCEDKFHMKVGMQDHLLLEHTGDITAFNTTKNATSLRYDLNDEQFPCRFCNKTFDTAISLNKHSRLHAKTRSCYCHSCGKTFNFYTSLQQHIRRAHNKSSSEKSIKQSWVRNKLNFFTTPLKRKPKKPVNMASNNDEPLNLVNGEVKNRTFSTDNITTVIPQSPPVDSGDMSDHGLSQHSSDNNWSETMSETHHDIDNGASEIRSAPKKSLLPKSSESSPKGGHHSGWKHRNIHPSFHANLTAMTSSHSDLPLNFSKSDTGLHDSNNNDSSSSSSTTNNPRQSPDLKLPTSLPDTLPPGFNINAANQLLMAKALLTQQTLAQYLSNTSQPMIFPPNHLPPSLVAMSQMMSLPVGNQLLSEPHTGTSKSPSPASHSSSKSETSPEDRDTVKDTSSASGSQMPKMNWGPDKLSQLWSFNMYSPDTGHTDGRKVTSLSRTHSRLGIIQSPINREALCKPTTLSDGRTIYKCPFCSKEFVSYSDINRHMDFHEDIRPYKCQYCDYYARTNSQLKVHMMRHQGIREFCCKLCNYKGVTQSDLNRHMKSQIHMLKSRNACKYCGEGFVTTKNLEKHLDGNCIEKMQKLNGGLDIPI